MAAEPQLFHYQGRGVRLAGERWDGDEEGAIVVLLHGGGQTRHSWKRTAARLSARGRTAVVLDLRGHGDSDWHPEQDYTHDGFLGDLLDYVATLDRPPVLVGASLGGIIALLATGEHPGVAHALVLVDVVVRIEPEGVARVHEFLNANPDGFASLDEVADAVAAYNPHRPRPPTADGLRKNVRQRADGRWYWHWDPAFVGKDGVSPRRFNPERLRAAAEHVDVPTLIVRGGQSDVVSEAGIADMLRLIPKAETVDVQAAGHMVAGDDNDVFAVRLDEFLDEIEGRG
jgi:non-heme chloroperoxidase